MEINRSVWLMVLSAYARLAKAHKPEMHPKLGILDGRWLDLKEAELERAFGCLMEESEQSDFEVRVFLKLLPGFRFAGGNKYLAQDAGVTSVSQMIGTDDFDPRYPWNRQAAKYRGDDERLIRSGQPVLNIVERQDTPNGVVYLHTSKVPLGEPGGRSLGLLGMYNLVDTDAAFRLMRSRT